MSTFQGSTQSGYSAISNYRLYLDLSHDDTEFSTGLPNPVALNEYVTPADHSLVFGESGDGDNYKALSADPQFSQFVRFIDWYNLKSHIAGCSLFAPINDHFDNMIRECQRGVLTPVDLIKYHTLEYPILPVQMYNRTLRLRSNYNNLYILTHGMSIISEGVADNHVARIIRSINTGSTVIYAISKPIIPYVY